MERSRGDGAADLFLSVLLTCHVSSWHAKGSWTPTRLRTLLFPLPSRLVDVWAGVCVCLLHVCLHYCCNWRLCRYFAEYLCARKVLWKSAASGILDFILSLLSVLPKFKQIQAHLWERHCRHQVLPKQLLLTWEVCCLAWLKSLEIIYMSVLSTSLVVKWRKSTVNL